MEKYTLYRILLIDLNWNQIRSENENWLYFGKKTVLFFVFDTILEKKK